MNEPKLSNRRAFQTWQLAMRLLGDTSKPEPSQFLRNCEAEIGVPIKLIAAPANAMKVIASASLRYQDRLVIIAPATEDSGIAARRWQTRLMLLEIYRALQPTMENGPIADHVRQLMTAPRGLASGDVRKSRMRHLAASYFVDIVLFHMHRADSLSVLATPMPSQKALLAYLDKLRDRRVLVLGAYSKVGLKRIDALARALKGRGWIPQILREMEGVDEVVDAGTVKETVARLSLNVEFTLLEDSEPSGHLIELVDLAHNLVPTVIVREEGHGSTILTGSFVRRLRTMREFVYKPTNLGSVLDTAIAWVRSLK